MRGVVFCFCLVFSKKSFDISFVEAYFHFPSNLFVIRVLDCCGEDASHLGFAAFMVSQRDRDEHIARCWS